MRHFFVLSLLVFAFITSVAQQTEKHTLYFNYGKDQLTSGSAGKLDNLLRELDTADVLQVHLEGHTDSDGSDAYNLKLSSRRVAFVLRYLIEKGISEGAIRTAYYGKSRPIASNSTPEGRQKNRRVEITVLHNGDISIRPVRNTTLPCASPIQVTEKEVLYFIYGKHELTAASKIKIDEILEKLSSQNIIEIRLSGHTDSDGSITFNMKLSEQRVSIVMNYLSAIGIEGDVVDGSYYGESRPVASNSTEAGKQKNRRVEMVISFNDCAEEANQIASETTPGDESADNVVSTQAVTSENEVEIKNEQPSSNAVAIATESETGVHITPDVVEVSSIQEEPDHTADIITPDSADEPIAEKIEAVAENNTETLQENNIPSGTPAQDVLATNSETPVVPEHEESEVIVVSIPEETPSIPVESNQHQSLSSVSEEQITMTTTFDLPADLADNSESFIPKKNEDTISAESQAASEESKTDVQENIHFTLQREEGYEITPTESSVAVQENKTETPETITFTLQQEEANEITPTKSPVPVQENKTEVAETITFTLQQEEGYEIPATPPAPETTPAQQPVEELTSSDVEDVAIEVELPAEQTSPVINTAPLAEPTPVSETPVVAESTHTQQTDNLSSETETETSPVVLQETEVPVTEEKVVVVQEEIVNNHTSIQQSENNTVVPLPAEDIAPNFVETVEERMTHIDITIEDDMTAREETADSAAFVPETVTAKESEVQTFTVPAGEEIVIQGKKGTTITIPENSLVGKDGTPVTDSVTVELQEVYTKSDMITTGLETASEGKLLESGGMVSLQIKSADNEEVQLSENSSYKVELPTESKKNDMTLFYADHTNGSMDWKLADRNTPDDSTYLENQKTLDKYVFRSSKLGWINADRFVGMEEKTNLRVNLGQAPPDVSVCMVFKSFNSVLNMTNKKKDILFSHIPLGEKATLVAFSKEGNKVLFASKDIVIQKDITESLSLQQLTETEFLERIRQLN